MWTILVAFILIAIIAAFSVVIVKLNKKDSNKRRTALLNRFRQLVRENDLSITDKEFLGDLVIGLDGSKRKLLIVKRGNNDDHDSVVINLNEITSSAKREVYGRVYPEKYAVLSNVLQLERIVLEIQFEDEREPIQISFYDYIDNSYHDLSERKQKVKRWETLLRNAERVPVRKRA